MHTRSSSPTWSTVHVSELLHELIREAGRHYTDFDGADPVASGVVALIARLLPMMPTAHSSVWLPRIEDPLLQPIAAAFDRDPADATSVDAWARRLGLSSRHFARLFKQDTGVTFSTWRALQQIKHALVLLATGQQVTRVAMDLGYSSTSVVHRDVQTPHRPHARCVADHPLSPAT